MHHGTSRTIKNCIKLFYLPQSCLCQQKITGKQHTFYDRVNLRRITLCIVQTSPVTNKEFFWALEIDGESSYGNNNSACDSGTPHPCSGSCEVIHWWRMDMVWVNEWQRGSVVRVLTTGTERPSFKTQLVWIIQQLLMFTQQGIGTQFSSELGRWR